MTKAYGKGDTLIVATLSYTGIIFSTMLGIAVWSDRLSLSSWLAMVMIVAAGVMAMTVGKNAKIESRLIIHGIVDVQSIQRRCGHASLMCVAHQLFQTSQHSNTVRDVQ